ncbi:MAG: hypothetical protein E6L09_02305 [Verrucomicrobia bacterium]|nr:MAG: hypothetical protein E6L09_02305 [Verrucomicrobiota bacterium]
MGVPVIKGTLKRRLLVNFTRASSLTGSGSRTIRLSSTPGCSAATSFMNAKSRGLGGPAMRLTSRLTASCQKPGLTPYSYSQANFISATVCGVFGPAWFWWFVVRKSA